MTFADFHAACTAAGFEARECYSNHWQIHRGNKLLVNLWPTTGKMLDGKAKERTKAKPGNPAQAIERARQLVEQEAIALARNMRRAERREETPVEANGNATGQPVNGKTLQPITIAQASGGYFIVSIGGKSAELGFDEVLGLFAALAMPAPRPQLAWLKTPEQVAAEQARMETMRMARHVDEAERAKQEPKANGTAYVLHDAHVDLEARVTAIEAGIAAIRKTLEVPY